MSLFNAFMKRAFDIVVVLATLVLLTPLIILVACRIKFHDSGPIFYRGVRVGRRGRLFRMFKFRTMVVNADKIGGSSTADDDMRITKVGRRLRKYKLDELPQLFNVLTGDMSLVGPRPEVEFYVRMFKPNEEQILSVRPGMTDWASLWNSDEGAVLAGAEDPEKMYMELIRPEKLRLQLKYVRERSFWVDLSILVQTALKVLKLAPTQAPSTRNAKVQN